MPLNYGNNNNNNKMNKIILSMGLFFIATNISAQHAIGTLSPEPSSAFDITSTTGGFLLPRMSNAERKLISNAAEGLQVYVTDYNNGSLMIFDGSNWNVFSKTIVVDDTTAPVITSPETGINLQENIEAGQTIYTITASDANGVGSYAIAGTDAALLSVNAGSGVVILTADPDYETKNSYSFAVTATDAAGNTSAATSVTFAIINVDEVVPTITSGVTGTNKAENIGAGQMIYTIAADANDGGTIGSYAIAGTDAGLLSVNAGSGVVTLTADPNYETKNSYSFTVTATDAAGTSAVTTVTFAITNVDEVVPTITSGATGTNKAENSGAGQTIYTIAATANDGGTIASYAIAGTDVDAGLLSVNVGGVVTLTADPDYETKPSYSFTVTASDAAGTSAATTVTFAITNIDEVVPTITSGTTGTNKAENSGAGQTIYTIAATANDGGTIASYTIAGTDVDAGLLSVNAGGVVTLTADPDYETKPSYSFTVTASDAAGTSAATTVTFAITNVDEVVPTITSGATGTNKAENSGAGQTIYIITADANDGGTIASYAISGTDAALLSVNAGGVVTLTADPDYETKNSYSFTVTATDAAGTSNATTVTFSITDVNEIVVEVGDSYEGGIVFYLAPSPTDLDGDGVNDIGLIYAYSNYTTTKPWNAGGWCGGCASISTSTAIGTGATNTTNIINEYSNSGTASAAGFARAYNGGGFNDWFLPSTLEQDALVSYFIEKYPASGGWSDWGGIRSNNYWSSSQHNGNKAKQRSFTTGTSPVNNNKGNAVRVIPIRAF